MHTHGINVCITFPQYICMCIYIYIYKQIFNMYVYIYIYTLARIMVDLYINIYV